MFSSPLSSRHVGFEHLEIVKCDSLVRRRLEIAWNVVHVDNRYVVVEKEEDEALRAPAHYVGKEAICFSLPPPLVCTYYTTSNSYYRCLLLQA